MKSVVDAMIVVGGGALVAHVLLCIVLQFRLRDHEDLARRLLAIPNRALLDDTTGVRLLRARYYLPWVRSGTDDSELDVVTRLVVAATRITGLIVPVALIGFILASILESSMSLANY